MKRLALIAVAIAFAPAVFADHCDMHLIDNTAYRLQQSSHHFASLVRSIVGETHTVRTAEELAEAAERLHEEAHHGAPCSRLDQEFHEVAEVFEHLTQDVREDHTLHHNPHVNADFARLRADFQAVDRAIHGGGIPGPRPVTTTVQLGSHNYRYAATALPGTITNVALVAQYSRARCLMGSSYGFSGNTLWVNYGCRGAFQVTYLAR